MDGNPQTDSPQTDAPAIPAERRSDVPVSLDGIQHGGNHYKSLAIQPAEYCHRNGFQFCEAEAIKYLSRFRSKNGAEDLKKAMHFCAMILDMEYNITATTDYVEQEPSEKGCPDDGSTPDNDVEESPEAS